MTKCNKELRLINMRNMFLPYCPALLCMMFIIHITDMNIVYHNKEYY